MEDIEINVIRSIVVIILYVITRYLLLKMVGKIAAEFFYQKPRVKVIKKIVNIILFAIMLSFILFIIGVDKTELVFFISSFLTVMGIGFFAQWSILSNITSTLIIFFNHPAKIGDHIVICEKDNEIEGKISDIGLFFVIVKNSNGEKITIPSNLFMQKMVKCQEPEL